MIKLSRSEEGCPIVFVVTVCDNHRDQWEIVDIVSTQEKADEIERKWKDEAVVHIKEWKVFR